MAEFTCYDLCGPDPNPMTKQEARALKALCITLPQYPIIIQIGAERGVSTMAMLEERPDAFIFSIDTGERQQEYNNLKRAGLPWQRVVRGLGRSQNIGQHWPYYWACDLLYIDGDHRRPGIDEDIHLWIQHVKPGGTIVFHDYIPNPGPHIHGRVADAVDELVELEVVLLVDRLKAFRQPE